MHFRTVLRMPRRNGPWSALDHFCGPRTLLDETLILALFASCLGPRDNGIERWLDRHCPAGQWTDDCFM